MNCLSFILLFIACFSLSTNGTPITYDHVRGTPYQVSYDHRAITINGTRTMLISGCIHYPRSTPGMWPYLMNMAKQNGLNTIQTYVFWNIHEQRPGVLDFSGRANLSRFLEEAAKAGLFVNLRIGPYVCAEWNYGGLPAWLNQVPNISFRSHNAAWENAMLKFIQTILDYVEPYLAKNGGPIILAQIENEYNGNDQQYVQWCGDLVTNEFSNTQIPWIMCNGKAANSTIETCNSCNCLDDGWIDNHRRMYPDKPMMFTENEGWFQPWGQAVAIRSTEDLAYSVGEWFAGGGAYHSYYMWHGGNNYGRTAASGITTMYADDVILHADGTPNEPKYTQLSRLQHIIASNADALLSQDSTRTPIPYWDGSQWTVGTQQFVYSYPPALDFVINQFGNPLAVLYRNQNITLSGQTVRIYDKNFNLLWDSSNVSNIPSDNTAIIPITLGTLPWKTWSESATSNLPVLTAVNPIEQLKITNDETIYLWYRRNITLTETSSKTIVQVETRKSNALLFFLDGEYLGEFDNHEHSQGSIKASVSLDLGRFKTSQVYLFEILSVSLGLDNGISENQFEYKGIIGNVWLNGQSLIGDSSNVWEHQKGLVGEYFQIYTDDGSTKVDWNSQWTQGINKPITWFQTEFDLDHIVREDLNANPILLDARGLNRGHAYINGNDLGLYWLIQGFCDDTPPCCCQQAQINCLQPTQRYYHIPSDWLKPKGNLLTVFDDLGASSPGSVSIVQRIVTV